VSPILTVDEALENEQLRARGMAIVKEGFTQLAPPGQVQRIRIRDRSSGARIRRAYR